MFFAAKNVAKGTIFFILVNSHGLRYFTRNIVFSLAIDESAKIENSDSQTTDAIE